MQPTVSDGTEACGDNGRVGLSARLQQAPVREDGRLALLDDASRARMPKRAIADDPKARLHAHVALVASQHGRIDTDDQVVRVNLRAKAAAKEVATRADDGDTPTHEEACQRSKAGVALVQHRAPRAIGMWWFVHKNLIQI